MTELYSCIEHTICKYLLIHIIVTLHVLLDNNFKIKRISIQWRIQDFPNEGRDPNMGRGVFTVLTNFCSETA